MLALILFALVEEDVDESAAAAVKDMEVLIGQGGGFGGGIGKSSLASGLDILLFVHNRFTH